MMAALCRIAIVIAEHAAKTFSALDAASCIASARQRNDQPVTKPLVVPLCMIMSDVLTYRCSQ